MKYFYIICIVLFSNVINGIYAESKDDSMPIQHPEVTAVEDLMREHGLLDRILLIYEEVLNRLIHNKTFRPESLHKAAEIVRNFVEDYHEKLEEEYVFPLLEQVKKLPALTKELRIQHTRGRKLTDVILRLSHKNTLSIARHRKQLQRIISQFIYMYRAHEAREDTEVFPILHTLLSVKEYHELSEMFEEIEHKHFGKSGFEAILKQVKAIEKELGIDQLAHYTPALAQ